MIRTQIYLSSGDTTTLLHTAYLPCKPKAGERIMVASQPYKVMNVGFVPQPAEPTLYDLVAVVEGSPPPQTNHPS